MSFISIQIPSKIAQNISKIEVPGKKEDSAELHITVCYIGKDLKIEQACKILEAVDHIISKFEPFTVSTDHLSHFPVTNNEPYPIILEVKSKELHDLNKKLCAQFDKDDIKYSKTFKDYRPHITLSYSDEAIKDRKIDKIEFEVSEIMFFAGDKDKDRFCITFPLQQIKNTNLLNKLELFSWASRQTP